MLTYKDKKKLNNLIQKLIALNQSLNLGTATLTPLNYSEEKEKFLRSDTYNPQFKYSNQNISLQQKEIIRCTEELHSLKLPKDLHNYVLEYVSSLSLTADAINTIGTSEFSRTVDKIFSFKNTDEKEFLKEISSISFNDPGNCKLKNAEEMAEIFREYLKNLQIGYTVEVDYTNDHIIRVGQQKLIVGAKVKRFCNNIQRLLTHEIDSHVLQRCNLSTSDSSLLRLIPQGDSLLWGEGLAVYNEIHSGRITKNAFETYYYRLKAVHMLDKSFREIFDYLSRYMKPTKAYMITYRVKRGMGNTQLPGGYTKDASYALGYQTVDTYIKKGGCIEMLYISRIPYIGEFLLENELIETTAIKIPNYLTTPISTVSRQTGIYPIFSSV